LSRFVVVIEVSAIREGWVPCFFGFLFTGLRFSLFCNGAVSLSFYFFCDLMKALFGSFM
jgi:hypothetical protein